MRNENACDAFRDWLPAYGAGQLPTGERAEIEHHLAVCASCRIEVAHWQSIGPTIRSAYANVPSPPSEEDLWQRVAARLPVAPRPQVNGSHPRRQSVRSERALLYSTPSELVFVTSNRPPDTHRRWSLTAVAALLLIAFLGIIVFTSLGPSHQTDKKGTPVNGTPSTTAISTPSTTAISTPSTTATTRQQIPSYSLSGNYLCDDFRATNDIWVGGTNGMLAHYNGSYWDTVILPTDDLIRHITMISATEGWAIGSKNNNQDALVLHFHNGTWTDVPLGTPNGPLFGVQVFAASDLWTWGNQRLFHMQGGSWHTAAIAPNGNLIQVLRMVSSGEAWASVSNSDASTSLWHWQNDTWLLSPTPIQQGAIYSDAIDILAPNDIWAWGEIPVTSQSRTESTMQPLSLQSSTGKSLSFLLHYDGVQWHQVNLPATIIAPTQFKVDGVFLRDDQDGWATLISFDANESPSRHMLRYANGQWVLMPIPANLWVHEVHLSSTDDAWAVATTLSDPRQIIFLYNQNDAWIASGS